MVKRLFGLPEKVLHCKNCLMTNQKPFSMNEVWNEQIKNSKLFGYESKNKFLHITNLNIYNKILKNY